jgi:hypothetical protein
LIAIAGFVLSIATSAQALTLAPMLGGTIEDERGIAAITRT